MGLGANHRVCIDTTTNGAKQASNGTRMAPRAPSSPMSSLPGERSSHYVLQPRSWRVVHSITKSSSWRLLTVCEAPASNTARPKGVTQDVALNGCACVRACVRARDINKNECDDHHAPVITRPQSKSCSNSGSGAMHRPALLAVSSATSLSAAPHGSAAARRSASRCFASQY